MVIRRRQLQKGGLLDMDCLLTANEGDHKYITETVNSCKFYDDTTKKISMTGLLLPMIQFLPDLKSTK